MDFLVLGFPFVPNEVLGEALKDGLLELFLEELTGRDLAQS
jgi:hypothetical protein